MNKEKSAKELLTYKGAVMTWECDSNGHMNVMYYINKFEHAGRNLGVESGTDDFDKKKQGIVVLEQKINYYKEVFEDDVLYVMSKMISFSNKTFTVIHNMYNTKTEANVARMHAIIAKFDKINRCAIEWNEKEKSQMAALITK